MKPMWNSKCLYLIHFHSWNLFKMRYTGLRNIKKGRIRTYGTACTPIFPCHSKGTEHCKSSQVPAPFTTHALYTNKGNGRRIGETAFNPRNKRLKKPLIEEGMILRKRTEEILTLVQKTEREITLSDQIVIGDVYTSEQVKPMLSAL